MSLISIEIKLPGKASHQAPAPGLQSRGRSPPWPPRCPHSWRTSSWRRRWGRAPVRWSLPGTSSRTLTSSMFWFSLTPCTDNKLLWLAREYSVQNNLLWQQILAGQNITFFKVVFKVNFKHLPSNRPTTTSITIIHWTCSVHVHARPSFQFCCVISGSSASNQVYFIENSMQINDK